MDKNIPSSPQTGSSELPSTSPAKKTVKWGRFIAWSVVILLLVIVGLRLIQVQRGPLEIGKPAPLFRLTTYENKEIDLEKLKGKVVVINFWASWCEPCEQEAADLETAWRYYQPRGDVAFIGVNWSDADKNALEYLKKYDITFPNGPDLGTRISQKYRITGVPETYILDQEGNLASFKFSPFQSVQEIQSLIDPLLE
jgi:cytochrome c biogenesis protein CcmG/thiol:disulfide interchange protein DsbE